MSHIGGRADGYHLTPLGYDFLALRVFVARGLVAGVGRQIGVGKEADVFLVVDNEGREHAIKIHRLGRTSFRSVRRNRDYLRAGAGGHASWLCVLQGRE